MLALIDACHPAPSSDARAASPIPVVRVPECNRPALLDSRVTITRFRSRNGPCVAENRLLGVQCGPNLDPTLLIGAASRRPTVYVGGRFGVAVPSRPAGATLVGRSPVAAVFASPNEPATVYVESSEGVRRWLRLPPAAELSTPPQAFLLGDSILFGSETFLADALEGWSTTFDAEVGRASLDGVPIAAAHADPAPDVAVVELGTNDADASALADNARAILESFARADLVAWVNVHSPASTTAAVNRAILAAVASRPNAVVADWNARAPEAQLSADGIHLTPGHEGAFARFLAPLLQSWRTAVGGAGLARCLPAVEAAARP